MKKILINFVWILVSVFVVLTFLGRKGDYAAQRHLWKINQKFNKISKDPGIVPSVEFANLVKEYEAYTKKFSRYQGVYSAELQIGRIYMVLKDYDKARTTFEAVAVKYKDNPEIAVRAFMETAKAYALENNQQGLIATYRRIINEYPLTEIGLKTPLLLIEFYIKNKQPSFAGEAIQSAVVHYQDIIQGNPKTVVGFQALYSLAICFQSQQRWTEAIEAYRRMIFEHVNRPYITPVVLDNVLKTISILSVKQLKNYDLPITIYQKFIMDHPGHAYNPYFEKMIKGLTALKEQNTNVKTAE